MVAPAIEGQFGVNVTIGVLREAVKALGFTDLIEVSLGGDYVAYSEAEEWAEAYKQGKKMTFHKYFLVVSVFQKQKVLHSLHGT